LATTYGTPSTPRPRRRGGVVGPLLLIFIGAVFLLQNTGYLPPTFWMNLWRLWPLILVLVGLEFLLAHRVPWPALAALGAVVLIAGAAATSARLPAPSTGPAVSQLAQTTLKGATQAAVTVRFGAGQLNIGPLDQAPADELADLTYQGPPELMPVPRYQVVNGGVGQLDYQVNGGPGPGSVPFINGRADSTARADLNFAPTVPITMLTVQTGATDAHLDLSRLHVNAIDLSVGAATAWIRLPESAGSTTAHISGGASTITLEIPEGVEAQIRLRGGLSTLNIDQTRFPQVSDGVYRSANYASAQNKVDISLETGVTTIQVS
jgi:hypothetical protein